MQYLLMIYEDESVAAAMSPEEQGAIFEEYRLFTEQIVKSGHFKAGDALQNVDKATSVRVKDGATVTTDGPFAETKEQLVGYYLIEAKDLDEAVCIAARIPAAKTGTIEVRPILSY